MSAIATAAVADDNLADAPLDVGGAAPHPPAEPQRPDDKHDHVCEDGSDGGLSRGDCLSWTPSRVRALKIAALVGTVHTFDHPDAHDRPSTNERITSSYDADENNANPIT